MSGPADRFRKRRAILADTDSSAQHSVRPAPCTGTQSASIGGLPVIVLPSDDGHASVAVDADALLAEIHGKLDSEKIEALIDACQKECLQAVIRPFGLARVLFQDKEGGNVDTIHNVRTQSKDNDGNERFLDSSGKELFRDKSGSLFYEGGTKSEHSNANGLRPIYVFANESERQKYESREDYDYGTYHDDNPNFKTAKKKTETDHDLDHPVSCKSVHDDTAIYLALLLHQADRGRGMGLWAGRVCGCRGAWQQGQRGRRRARPTLKRRRMVGMEAGAWRSGRSGGWAGSSTTGKLKTPARPPAGGGCWQRRSTRKP